MGRSSLDKGTYPNKKSVGIDHECHFMIGLRTFLFLFSKTVAAPITDKRVTIIRNPRQTSNRVNSQGVKSPWLPSLHFEVSRRGAIISNKGEQYARRTKYQKCKRKREIKEKRFTNKGVCAVYCVRRSMCPAFRCCTACTKGPTSGLMRGTRRFQPHTHKGAIPLLHAHVVGKSLK